MSFLFLFFLTFHRQLFSFEIFHVLNLKCIDCQFYTAFLLSTIGNEQGLQIPFVPKSLLFKIIL